MSNHQQNMNHFLVVLTFVLIFNSSVNGIGQLSSRIVSLSSNTTQEFTIYDNIDNRLPESVRFLTIGVHSQQFNITLFKLNNYINNDTRNNSITGHNIGLVLIANKDYGNIFIENNNSVDINVLLTTIFHKDNDPIPGACNEEFPLEISPFLRLYANQYVNRLEYQFANIGSPKGYEPLKCDKTQFLIKYDIYAYFLQENDFSETEYFRAITLMSNETEIKQSAIHLNTSSTRAYFYSYPGRAIVYNIIATSQHYSSSYIPIVTYDCDDFSQCGKLNLLGIIIAVSLGLIGFVVCLRGHYWFQLQMLFFGFIDGSFIGYILLLRYSSLNDSQISIYTLAIGVIVSLLWFSIWKIIHIPLISLLLSGFSLGFVFVATVLFTSIGNLELFQNDMNYWLIMGCTIFLTTLFFLMINAIVLSVVSTSIVGSYLAIIGIDRFIDGSISYIAINVIKRAVYNYKALNNVPFQNKDIVLSIMWILLSLTGITLQLYNSIDRSPFPPPSGCSHPHRDRSRTRRRLYQRHGDQSRVHCRRSFRTPRFNPSPTAPLVDNNNQVIDERTALLYPNLNNLNNGNNSVYRSSPYESQNYNNFSNNTNTNGREYQSI